MNGSNGAHTLALPQRGWRPYVVALGSVVLAAAARVALTPTVGPTSLPFIFFFPAVTAVAWYGGLRPAVVALIASALVANWFFIAPLYAFALDFEGWVSTLAFIASSGFILAALEGMHRSRRELARQITERRAADRAHSESRDLLATTLASIGDGVIVTTATGNVSFINPEAQRLTGWTRGDAIGQPLSRVFNIVNETTRQPVESPVDKVLRLGTVVGLANHTVLISKQGTDVPIDDSGAPVRREGGDVLGVVLVFRDVTEQRAADYARARLAAIVEHAGDAILTKDLNGTIQTWNAAAERLFGHRAEDVIGRSITLLIPPERLGEEELILSRLRAGQVVERLETVRVAKGGSPVHVAISVSPIKDRHGRVIGASKIIRDIGDMIAARSALEREKELLATTLASIGDAVIVTDIAGRVTFMNGEAQRLTGWSLDDARSHDLPAVFRIINEETRHTVENPVDKVMRSGKVVGLANHTLLIARDGHERPVDDSAAPIRLSDGEMTGIVLVFRDVTERHHAESILRESDRRKEEFLAILSHELRNPLAPIGMAVTMLRKLGPADPQMEHMRDIIARQTSQLARLLDDLLDVSRISSGKIALRRQRIRLDAAVASGIEAVRPLIDSQQHQLIVKDSSAGIEVDADLGRIAQVVANLLNNAAKFTPPGGRIEIHTAVEGGEASIRVRDNGIGIAADQLSNVFEMFAQVDQSLERGQGGLGVGLSLARNFVRLHGGRLDARSDGLGKGSEFIVRLPILKSQPVAVHASTGESVKTGTGRRRVLVADDNEDSAFVLAEALRLSGHQVAVAHDGLAAIEQAAIFRPQVIILDIGMPRVSGYEVASRLRIAHGHDIVLIAVTGWGKDEDKRRATEAGFDHHLTKPVDLRVLEDLLARES